MRRWWAIVVIVAMLVAAGARDRAERLAAAESSEHELLYLPNGRYLRIVSLGQGPLLADVIYLWAIQFYSNYDRADRYRFVQHIFGKVIPELDPRYIDPYWLGALILIVEVDDLEGGLQLLDEGFEHNPRAWILPYLAGWECQRAGEPLRAASYFERAAAVPGAPDFVGRMSAGMLARAGHLAEAIRMWEEVRRDPGSDAAARAIAERWLHTLEVRRDLEQLRAAVGTFHDRFGRYPRRLQELVTSGVLRALPPADGAFDYDPATGRVDSPAGRILGAQ
jgi:hypothetical protein